MTVKGYVVPDMPAAAHRVWAKEMMLDTIDKHLHEHPEAFSWDPHDQDALRRERNRIAKMFGLPEKGWGEFPGRAPKLSVEEHNAAHDAALKGRD